MLPRKVKYLGQVICDILLFTRQKAHVLVRITAFGRIGYPVGGRKCRGESH